MKKNKYRWRTFEEEIPKTIKFEIQDIFNPGIKVHTVTRCNRQFLGSDTMNEFGFMYDNGEEKFQLKGYRWRPIKPKLNKYRWREMKDEKPDVGEYVLVSQKSEHYLSRFPYVAQFNGGYDGKSFMITPLGKMEGADYCPVLDENILWRKMCKLPGEK